MAHKLIEVAGVTPAAPSMCDTWSRSSGAGAKFENGKLIERPDEATTKEAAA